MRTPTIPTGMTVINLSDSDLRHDRRVCNPLTTGIEARSLSQDDPQG